MKKLVLLLLLAPLSVCAQLNETFADGDFTQNPAWLGDAASFQVTSQQLQSNGPATTGTVLELATPTQASTGTTWEFYANLKFATSSGNYADVWLMADQASLKATGTKGYFVRLGGTLDEVSLFRKDAPSTPTYVINGQDGTLSSLSNNVVRVRVTRSFQDVWTLERDLTGGQTYTSEGAAPDATYQRSAYAGVVLTYSSANNRSFFFDDFRITDATAPTLVRASMGAARQLDVVFNEAVAVPSPASYQLNAGSPGVLAAARDASDPALVHLTLVTEPALGPNTLTVRNVADLYGNSAAGLLTTAFSYSGTPVAPGINQLLITEILADETPVIGLPASEYLEIYNPSPTAVLDLGGMRLVRPSSTSAAAVFPAGATLLPGEYAVVCGSTRVAQFAPYGKVFGLANFPALNNAGDQLVLRSRDGRTLFEVSYSSTWYKDASKTDGGWSLEMVDTANPCGGIENWTASMSPSGGTPGKANSVKATNPDHTPPALLRALALSPTVVRLFFGEKLDSVQMANPGQYALTPANQVAKVSPASPDFRTVDLALSTPLLPSQAQTVTVQQATDCVGNAAGPATSATFALPTAAAAQDVVVNEILFNPRTGGVDFVELLNRSAHYLNVQGWQLANERPDGTVDTEPISSGPVVLAPGQLLVLTTRPDVVQRSYPTNDPSAFLAMPGFPIFPDDAGIVVVYDALGKTLDRVPYSAKQHLSLLADVNGVSLERIRTDGPGTAANFHSAASTAGYATPGRPNSQYQDDPGGDRLFRLEPEVFTPDEDGLQDFTTLNYTLDQPGYAASVTVYDAQGRLVRQLVRNETMATRGFFQWDGLNDQGRKAPVGYYILHIQLFQPNGGGKQEYKKTVVLGTRF